MPHRCRCVEPAGLRLTRRHHSARFRWMASFPSGWTRPMTGGAISWLRCHPTPRSTSTRLGLPRKIVRQRQLCWRGGSGGTGDVDGYRSGTRFESPGHLIRAARPRSTHCMVPPHRCRLKCDGGRRWAGPRLRCVCSARASGSRYHCFLSRRHHRSAAVHISCSSRDLPSSEVQVLMHPV